MYMFILLFVCVYVYMHICLWRPEEGFKSFEVRVKGTYEPPDLGSGIQTQVLMIEQ